MQPNPDAMLAQGVLRRGLISLQELEAAMKPADGRRPDSTLLDLLAAMGTATREELEKILEEERASAGSDSLPPEVLTVLARPDARLGRYVRTQIIGQGGTAVVWQAWDLETHRMVALKMLAPPGQTPTRHALREARIALELSHPNIVPVFEVADAHDAYGRTVHYLAMAWIDGTTGDQLRPPVDEALRILRDVARAVQAAHDRGIIHRDIKPGNLIVDRAGRPYIMDFGLAKPVEGALDTATREGLVLGTPAFMPPEQALGRNKELTPQADVYSLGATLYSMLCGRAPYDGDSPIDICMKVVREAPPPARSLTPGLPADVDAILSRAMARDRNHRYRTPRALADDIDRYLRRLPILGEDELRFSQAMDVLREGRLEEAIYLFRELKRLGRTKDGGTLTAAQDQLAGEILHDGQALAKSPQRLDLQIDRGWRHLATAVLRTMEKQPAGDACACAEEDFAAALAHDPEDAAALIGRGLALVLRARLPGEEGRFDRFLTEAAAGFAKASANEEIRPVAMHNRGITSFYLARKAGDRKRDLLHAAISDFAVAVGGDPSFAFALKDLGVAKLALAQVDPAARSLPLAPISEAVQHFTRALELRPDLESALFDRGRSYFALGRYAEAIDDWRRCSELSATRSKQVESMIAEARGLLARRGAE